MVIGAGSTLGCQSCVAPGTTLPPGSVLKPGSATSHPSSLSTKGLEGAELRNSKRLPVLLQLVGILLAIVVTTVTWILTIVPAAMLWWWQTPYEWCVARARVPGRCCRLAGWLRVGGGLG